MLQPRHYETITIRRRANHVTCTVDTNSSLRSARNAITWDNNTDSVGEHVHLGNRHVEQHRLGNDLHKPPENERGTKCLGYSPGVFDKQAVDEREVACGKFEVNNGL